MRIEDLIAYVDGELAPEDHRRVEAAMVGDPEAVPVLAELCFQRFLLADIMKERQAAPVATIHRNPLRLWLSLAAAAAVLVCAGLFALRDRSGVEGMQTIQLGQATQLTITEMQGDVSVAESTVQGVPCVEIRTGTKALCKAQYNDGTVLALDQGSHVNVSQHPETAGKIISQESGQLYFSATPQSVPAAVRWGGTDVKLLGTKILAGRSERPWVDVLEGRVHMDWDRLGAYVGAAQGLRCMTDKHGQRDILGGVLLSKPKDTTWLAALGVDAQSIWPQRPSPTALVTGPGSGWDEFRIPEGHWRVAYQDGGPTIRNDLAELASIELGSTFLKSGMFGFDFRVADTMWPLPRLGVAFFNKTGTSASFSLKREIRNVWRGKQKGWMRAQFTFDVDQDNKVRMSRCEYWSVEDPAKKITVLNEVYDTGKLMPGGCRIGLRLEGCSIEFRNLAVTDAVLVQ